MTQTANQNGSLRTLLVAGLTVLLLVTMWSWASVQANNIDDDNREARGRIDSFPAGLIGTWVVDGVTYVANDATEFKQEEGPFAIGKCVKVDYVDNTSPFTIHRIDTETDSDCNGGATETPDASSTPDETETPDASVTPSVTTTSDDHNDRDTIGVVDSLPNPGLTGTWIIDEVEYVANGSTEFEQKEGPFVTGACVEVKYVASSSPFVIHEIETKDMKDCQRSSTSTPSVTTTPDGSSTPDPSVTPDASATPMSEIEVSGRVESFPAGLVGDWVVNGVTYRADAGTEFEEEHGPFAMATCVKIYANPTTSPARIREIETTRDFRCNGGNDDDSESEIFGIVQNFPASLIGNWNVGGMTFVVDASTEFKQENGLFVVGGTVKIHFVVVDGVNRAREIETKFENDDDGDDDNNNGSFEGAEGHAFGSIDSFPDGLSGQWTIGGIAYVTTAETKFEEENGPFAIGARVKVDYYLNANNDRLAQEIETTSDDGGASEDSHFKLYGFVNQMPPDSLAGTWFIDNIAFETAESTQFKEENGLFAIGTFVEVEYFMQEGRHIIHEIETHVPPGAGDHTEIGKIERRDNIHAAQLTAGGWVVGGQSYTVTSATDLNESRGAIAVGEMVLVNSYTAPDGSEIATQIRGITLNNTLLLPIVVRN